MLLLPARGSLVFRMSSLCFYSIPPRPFFLQMTTHSRLLSYAVHRGGGCITGLLADASPMLLRLVQFLSYRAASSTTTAAAVPLPQLDYDLYDSGIDVEKQKRCDRCSAAPDADYEGAIPVKGVHWAFIGEPSSKKHVYAELLSRLLEVPRISIGSLVRQELSPRSILYKRISSAVNSGKLVPESIIFGLLSQRLDDVCSRGQNGFILDGIPRTRTQAEILDQLIDIDLVVNFKGSKGLNISSGGAESIVSPFYREQVEMLEDYYSNQKKLKNFQVGSAPLDTWKSLLAALHLQHINAARSYRALRAGFKKS